MNIKNRIGSILLLAGFALLLTSCDPPKKHDDSAAIVAALSMPMCKAVTYDEAAASIANGTTQYAAQCASCHGNMGQGGVGPKLVACTVCGNYQSLATRIDCTMPLGNPGACTGDCARDIAKYIRATF